MSVFQLRWGEGDEKRVVGSVSGVAVSHRYVQFSSHHFGSQRAPTPTVVAQGDSISILAFTLEAKFTLTDTLVMEILPSNTLSPSLLALPLRPTPAPILPGQVLIEPTPVPGPVGLLGKEMALNNKQCATGIGRHCFCRKEVVSGIELS